MHHDDHPSAPAGAGAFMSLRRPRGRRALLLAAAALGVSFITSSRAQTIPTASGQQWISTWTNEFNTGASDLTGFTYDLGGGGWGNNEKEVYTNSWQIIYVAHVLSVLRSDSKALDLTANFSR